ncbi:AprI/Inh family metalloprotease inhibitor [Methylobacterium haplocladii]|uniref:Alkaline proteinase inhibitor/ Outer membrane lipoprotein Omp19 domain-containing protein n=1 Tax=Methylobacterium haplocladii TaxID=1176176 RepID=A0A512IP91_9HYPH|nr:AprI/Inh family metalloprotease inhibitor [Methylobacterium haplocladii]GEO99482.1 hypothetical protein MHA02_18700 [Methylobacterium haplocladii]GJD83311.1 hypothetical protein HPGCJGGD_1177 [Methylobacterium haplocladii]GLS60393.1 hypothetical protein GCM10007887_30720 [Methylobacterium haplocladii]
MIRGATAGLAILMVAGLPLQAQETPSRGDEPPAAVPEMPPTPASLPALKTLPETLGDAVGMWDMSLDGSNRRCELTLSADSGPDGRVLRFPAGCRRALPILSEAAGWLFAEKGIRLVDRNVRPVITFTPRADQGSLGGTAERGGTYSLVPLQTLAMLPPPPAVDGAVPGGIPDVALSRDIPGSQPVLGSGMLAKPDIAARADASAGLRQERSERPAVGTYALDRFAEKDVCRIVLDSRPSTAKAEREPVKELSPAHLLPGCRDGGIATFDPVSWRYASGHLTLKARRGHAINLVPTGEGSWRRDPDTGTTLVLRKVAP